MTGMKGRDCEMRGKKAKLLRKIATRLYGDMGIGYKFQNPEKQYHMKLFMANGVAIPMQVMDTIVTASKSRRLYQDLKKEFGNGITTRR